MKLLTMLAFNLTLIILFQPKSALACEHIKLNCPNSSKSFSIKTYSTGIYECMPSSEDLKTAIMSECLPACSESQLTDGITKTKGWLNASNNCSVERVNKPIDPVFEKVFGVACEVHDLCYLAEGQEQDTCDREFYENMEEVCSGRHVGLGACLAAREVLYLGVRIGGSDHTSFNKNNLCRALNVIEAIEIDCSVKGAKNGGTKGMHRITIFDRSNNRLHTGRYKIGGGCDSSNYKKLAKLMIPADGIPARDFGKIVFDSRSNDALVIDKLVLDFNDNHKYSWGTSNDVFYCLDSDLSKVAGKRCNRQLSYVIDKSGKVYTKN